MSARRRLLMLLGAAVVAVTVPTTPASAAPPTCDASLFVPTDGGAYVVEQPDSAPGAVFCSGASGLTFGVETAPAHGLLTALTANGTGGATFSYLPALGYSGADSFVLRVEHGTDPAVLVSVAVSVRSPVNDAPECTATLFASVSSSGYRVETGEEVSGRIDCFDDESDPLTYAVSTAAAHGTVSAPEADSASGASFTYRPGVNPGDDSFALTANDGSLTSEPAEVDVTIATATNEAPVCTADLSTTADVSGAYEIQEGQSVAGLVLCDDDDGDPLSFATTRAPAHGVLTPLVQDGDSAIEATYTAPSGYEGFDEFRVSADDGTNVPTEVVVRVRVVPQRDNPPRCTVVVAAPVDSDRYRVEEGKTIHGRLDCADETDPLAYSVSPGPGHGTVSTITADGQFTYSAASGFTGADAFTLVASDGAHRTTAVVSIQITASVNDSPICQVALSAGIDADGRFLIPTRATPGRVTCTDDEGDPLSFALALAPGHGTISGLAQDSATTAGFTLTPTTGYLGNDAFRVSVSDGVNAPQVIEVTVTVVEPTPSAPHCSGRLHTAQTADGYEVEAGETVQGTLSCFDADGDPLSYSVGLPPTGGTTTTPEASGGAARFTYTAGDTLGQDRFELVASDGAHSSNVVSVRVNIVAPYNSPPECSIGLFTTPLPSSAYPAENAQPNDGVVACVDDEGDPLSFDVTTAAQHGDIVGLTGSGSYASFAYVADPGFIGTDSATVRISDGAGGEDVVTLNVDVSASTNTAPTCTATVDAPQQAGAYVVAAGTSAAGQVSCQDAESDALAFDVLTAPTIGSLTALSGSGGTRTFTFTAPSGPGGSDTFVLRVTDARGATRHVAVAVRITATPTTTDPGTAAGASTGAPGGAGGIAHPTALASTQLGHLKLASPRKHDRVHLTFTTVTARQSVTVILRTGLKGKLTIVGKATKRYTKAGKHILDVKLTSAGRKALKKQHKLRLRVAISSTSPAHAPLTRNKRLTLRAKT